MGLADEILKLKELHADGTLTDREFEQAKAALLAEPAGRRRDAAPGPRGPEEALAATGRRWVNFQIAMAVVGVVLVLAFFFGFFLPQWNESRARFDRGWKGGPPDVPTDPRPQGR